MLKREDIKQAIDEIAARDPEIGYTLDGMFGTGRIDIDTEPDSRQSDTDLSFLFDDQRVPVNKFSFFSEGPCIIEQHLLIKYGEMIKRREIDLQRYQTNFRWIARSIRKAGVELLVQHEIAYAWSRALAKPGAQEDLSVDSDPGGSELQDLAGLCRHFGYQTDESDWPQTATDPRVLFAGGIDFDRPAYFVRMPYTLEALMQAADLDLEFFHVRFILDCLEKRTSQNLFACVVNDAIVGLVYLGFKKTLFYKGIEIKYLASAAKRTDESIREVKGVGTFLVAGTWMLWKNRMPAVDEILLDSEVRAVDFYERIGFKPRQLMVYVLKKPAGPLLKALAQMADRSPSLQPNVVAYVSRLLKGPIRTLTRPSRNDPARVQSLAFVKACLAARFQPILAQTAARLLIRYKDRIPEADSLLEFGTCNGRIRLVTAEASLAEPLLILKDARLSRHLQGIFHLDSSKRLDAIDAILQDPALDGKWTCLSPRAAVREELAWVHTAEHIDRVVATAGKGLQALDLDTQTTADSYETACLAVGGVFTLLDEIWQHKSRRGFAAIRPPGHHAEPDKAMGFCLFNNAALGAHYLQNAYGVKRIMIVDIDAHHGNGTQSAFYDSRSVLYFSMHQFPGYPGTGNFGETGIGAGEGFTVNVPIPKGAGDREFVQALFTLFGPLACAYEPEIILVSCGFDLYRFDPLAGMQATAEGYAMLTRLLLQTADTVCGGKIAFILEGGYNIQGIEECGRMVFKEMCGLSSLNERRLENYKSGNLLGASFLRKSIEIQRKYWNVLA